MRRLYRVTGVWRHEPTANGDRPADTVVVRHYMTKKAAEHRASVFRDGRAALATYDHMNGPEEVAGPIRPAFSVSVEASDPITWPTS